MEVEKKYDIAIVISGPEPQRTIFEDLLLNQLSGQTLKILLVRGLPGNSKIKPCNNANIEIQNHLSADELNKAIQQSAMIISRSGYTTIMDLVKLQKAAILIPTPGQKEQEYLAGYLMEQKLFYCVSQEGFSLPEALTNANNFSRKSPSMINGHYKKIINEFIASIVSKTGQ